MPKAKLPDKNFKWTPNLAYVIGLITTDGCLSSNGRSIIMRSSDTQLLRTFKKCLDLPNKIYETKNNGWAKKPSYRIQFGSVQFYRWLLKIGLTPRKTYTIGALDIPDEYFKDFLRGHLDGDGSVYTYQDRYNHYKGRTYTNQRIYTNFCSASQLHAIWLYDKISTLTEIKGTLIRCSSYRPNRVPIWKIKFAKKTSLELWKWIYYKKNLPCLKRKMILAQRLSKLITKEKRRKYTKVS